MVDALSTRAEAAERRHAANRAYHAGVDKIRGLAHTAADGTRNLASATQCTCSACAEARIKRVPHSSTLAALAPQPPELAPQLVRLHHPFCLRALHLAVEQRARDGGAA